MMASIHRFICQPFFPVTIRHAIGICFFILICPLAVVPVVAQENNPTNQTPTANPAQSQQSASDDAAAQVLAQIAVGAQNAEDYSLAAQQWEKLITDFPKSKLIGKAHYNAGVCYVQLQKYEPAATQLAAAIPLLAGDEAKQQPQAYLYLGFCQFRQGRSLFRAGDESKKNEANILLTTSTQTLATLLKQFPQFADNDQAAFFQGNAFEDLGRLEDAAASYAHMITYPKQTFKFDGLYALANVNEQLGKFSDALTHYQKFRSEADAAGGHPLIDEVNFRTAQTHIGLALADTNRGDKPTADKNYAAAQTLLSAIVAQGFAEKPAAFREMADEAQYQLAYCAAQLGDYQRAAETYAAVADRADSAFKNPARINAAYSYIKAEKTDLAITALTTALASEDAETAATAAATLSNLYLKSGQVQAAYDLASQWIPKSADSPRLTQLMLDRADAAYQLPEKRAQSPALFLEIVDKFPQHESAPSATYNAAFAFLELNQLDEAIAAANRFEKNYSDNSFLPDTLEVKADALLLKNDAESAAVFDQLLTKYPDHEKSNRWLIRSALSKFVQKKYQPVIDLLTPKVESFTDATQKAEALHWIGSSQFNLEQYEAAIPPLTQSLAADPKWRSADETRLTLSRALFQTKKIAEAKQQIEQLIAAFPDSALLGKAYFYLGESEFESGQFEAAFKNFSIVIAKYPQSDLVPLALYNAAWSQMERKQFEDSIALFSRIIDEFPQHDLAAKAKSGRGAARRKTGKMEGSIEDMQAFLKSNPSGSARFNALYELGLAQVEQSKWADAIPTFEALLAEETNSTRLDRYHYELAWANQSINQPAKALEHFGKIASDFPDSSLASEANFHLGTAAYQNEKWKDAIAAFEKSVAANSDAAGNESIREKALYKLGWAHYKQNQFADSEKQFANQVAQFPSGELFADGQFMVAESQFRQDKWAEALKNYLLAKPAIAAAANISPDVRTVAHLHGSQAANKAGSYQDAIDFATPLTTGEAEDSVKQDAWLEIGSAHLGLKKFDEAKAALEQAAVANNKTGARAGCLIGDLLFGQRKFEEAITQYKLVYYRFSGPQTPADIKPWLAYSLYESGQCSFVQISSAPDSEKAKLKSQAQKQFETLVKNFPDDKLAPQASKQLNQLEKL